MIGKETQESTGVVYHVTKGQRAKCWGFVRGQETDQFDSQFYREEAKVSFSTPLLP